MVAQGGAATLDPCQGRCDAGVGLGGRSSGPGWVSRDKLL